MATNNQNVNNSPSLPTIEAMLAKNYDLIQDLCAGAGKQATKVATLEAHTSTSDYATTCTSLIGETEEHIQSRKGQFIPYIKQLRERVESNHDCTNCTGNCKLNHELQVFELNISADLMKKIINKMQLACLPLYSETIYPDEYRRLRNQMALIENSLAELLSLEQKYLIPRILEAQKMINAH